MMVSLTRIGDILIIRAPYHPLLVAEIKRIPGRKYSGSPLRVWSVPAQYEEQIRAIVRNYFPIEDEPNVVFEGAPEPLEGPFAVLKLEFIGENYYAYKRQAILSHPGSVGINRAPGSNA